MKLDMILCQSLLILYSEGQESLSRFQNSKKELYTEEQKCVTPTA